MIYDIILFVLVGLFVFVGIRRGAAKSLAGILTAFVSYTAATFLGKLISVKIYELVLRPTIHDTVVTEVAKFSNSSMQDTLDKIDFGSFNLFGIEEALKGFVTDKMQQPIENISVNAGATAETVLEPIVIGILSFFITIFLFFLFYILLRKFVMPLLLNVFKIPVIKQVNAILGGVIGAVEALLLVCMIAYLLHLIIPQVSSNVYLLQESTIYESFIFKHLYDGNIFSMFASWLTL